MKKYAESVHYFKSIKKIAEQVSSISDISNYPLLKTIVVKLKNPGKGETYNFQRGEQLASKLEGCRDLSQCYNLVGQVIMLTQNGNTSIYNDAMTLQSQLSSAISSSGPRPAATTTPTAQTKLTFKKDKAILDADKVIYKSRMAASSKKDADMESLYPKLSDSKKDLQALQRAYEVFPSNKWEDKERLAYMKWQLKSLDSLEKKFENLNPSLGRALPAKRETSPWGDTYPLTSDEKYKGSGAATAVQGPKLGPEEKTEWRKERSKRFPEGAPWQRKPSDERIEERLDKARKMKEDFALPFLMRQQEGKSEIVPFGKNFPSDLGSTTRSVDMGAGVPPQVEGPKPFPEK